MASANDTLGRVLAGRTEWARAEALLHEALSVRIKHDLLLYMPHGFDARAEVAAGLDSREEAARTLGIADRLRADLGLARWGPDERRFARLEDAVRSALGNDAYELAHRQGNEL